MGYLNQLYTYLNMTNSNHRVGDRLMRNSALVVCILILPTVIVNIAMEIPPLANAILVIGLIIYGWIYIKTRQTPASRSTQYLFFGTGIGMSFPLWFLNGGANGPMAPYLILLLLMVSFTAGRKQQSTIVIVYLVSLIVLISAELMYPSLVWEPIGGTKKVVIMAGLFFASIGAAVLVTSFRINFLRDRKKLLRAQSDLMSTNLQLEYAKKESDKASKAKSAFLASVSHEIRTPLNSIIGAIDLLKLHDLKPDQKMLFQLMNESSETLLQLLTDVLDLSKIEADKIKIRAKHMHISDFVKNMANFTEALIIKEKKEIEFKYSIGDLPSSILTDEVRLTQILTNLLSNAIKYTQEGKVELVVATNKDNPDELFFCVSDTGMGIEPENLEFIKRPFNQVSDQSKERENEGETGVGLGLTITRSLLRLMKGRLIISSDFGVGSRFTAYLPLTPSEEKQVTPPILNVTGIPKFEGISALIVEDNKFNQIILQRMLESLGVDCDIANNGLECLSIWQERNYDLILMDLNMPGLDGIETTKRILKDAVHEPIPKIIAVTANVLDQDEQRCLDAGMHSFLPKPITMAELSSRIVAATADS